MNQKASEMDKTIEFAKVEDKCCGLDVGNKVIVITVEGTGIASQKRKFESTTGSLTNLRKCLLELRVTHVVMESTRASYYCVPCREGAGRL